MACHTNCKLCFLFFSFFDLNFCWVFLIKDNLVLSCLKSLLVYCCWCFCLNYFNCYCHSVDCCVFILLQEEITVKVQWCSPRSRCRWSLRHWVFCPSYLELLPKTRRYRKHLRNWFLTCACNFGYLFTVNLYWHNLSMVCWYGMIYMCVCVCVNYI